MMRLAPDREDEDGVWYGVWITDMSTNETTWGGSLKFPRVDGKATVLPEMYSTPEIYGPQPNIRLIDIPEWYVSMKRAEGDGNKAEWGTLGYSGNESARGTPPNADVQYDRDADVVHLRIGGATQRVGPAEPVRVIFD